MGHTLFSWNYVVIISLWLGWGLATAGAIAQWLHLWRSMSRWADVASALHRLSLLVISVGLLLAGVLGPAIWVRPSLSDTLAVAGASLALLLALVWHPSSVRRVRQVFDLILAWLVVAAGVWGVMQSVSVISTALIS
jgi:hypothetical protein